MAVYARQGQGAAAQKTPSRQPQWQGGFGSYRQNQHHYTHQPEPCDCENAAPCGGFCGNTENTSRGSACNEPCHDTCNESAGDSCGKQSYAGEQKGGKSPFGGIFSFLDGILGNFHVDSERTLLVLLLIILAKDGADMKLLLALGYLLM